MKLPQIFALITATLLFSFTSAFLPENTVFSSVKAQNTETEDKQAEADRLLKQGIYLYTSSQFEKALQSCEEALKLYEDTNNKSGISQSLMLLGFVYLILGDSNKSTYYYNQALNIAKERIDLGSISSLLNNIGTAYLNKGENKKAIDYYQQSLSIAQEIEDQFRISSILNNIGNAYLNKNEYYKAIDYYEKSLAIAEKINDLSVISKSLSLPEKINKDNRTVVLYDITFQRDMDTSVERYNTSNIGPSQSLSDTDNSDVDISRKISYHSRKAGIYNNLGITYMKLENYSEAILYFQKSLIANGKEIRDYSGQAGTYNNIAYLLEKQNQSSVAILFYKKTINIYEQIRNDLRGLDLELQKSYLNTIEDTYRRLADLLLEQDRILEAQRVLDLLKVQELDDYLRGVRGTENSRPLA